MEHHVGAVLGKVGFPVDVADVVFQQRDVIDDASQIFPSARPQGVKYGHLSRGFGEQFPQVRADEAGASSDQYGFVGPIERIGWLGHDRVSYLANEGSSCWAF